MKELNYVEVRAGLIDRMEDVREIVLATCHNNKVTARTVSCVSADLKIYFLTSRAYTKFKQIEKNPTVALCAGEVQIEGTAVIKGHPLLPENAEYQAIFTAKAANFFDRYARYKNSVLIEVTPILYKSWKFAEGKHFTEYLDLEKGLALRKG